MNVSYYKFLEKKKVIYSRVSALLLNHELRLTILRRYLSLAAFRKTMLIGERVRALRMRGTALAGLPKFGRLLFLTKRLADETPEQPDAFLFSKKNLSNPKKLESGTPIEKSTLGIKSTRPTFGAVDSTSEFGPPGQGDGSIDLGIRMPILIKFVIVFILLSNVFFCASVRRYGYNRGSDLKDVVNIGIEKNIYGINTLTVGYQDAINGTGIGLRHGHLGIYETGDNRNKILKFDAEEGESSIKNEAWVFPGDSNVIISTTYHKSRHSTELRVLKKHFLHVYPWRCYPPKSGAIFLGTKKLVQGRYCGYTFINSYHPASFELSIGFYLGVRIGINLMELLDFSVGIVGFDLMDDDIGEPVYRELPQPTLQNENWESKVDALDEKMDNRGKK